MVQDALFATLDPTVRQAETPDNRIYTLVDTVGFVRNLPTQLVEAFRSTLEEVAEADLILHVVDAAHPDPIGQVRTVHEVIADIEGATNIPELIVLNKSDLASPEEIAILRSQIPHSVAISAATGKGLDELEETIAAMLPRPAKPVDVVVPYEHGDLVHRFHETGEIEFEEYLSTGTHLVGRVDAALAHELDDRTCRDKRS